MKLTNLFFVNRFAENCTAVTTLSVYWKQKWGFCLRLQVKPTQLGPIDRAGLYLRRQIESGLRNAVFWNINRTVFQVKTGRWLMPRNMIFVLMYHRHKLLDLTYMTLFSKGKVKAKLSLLLTNETLRHEDVWGSECIDSHFLDLGTSWTWVVSFTPL
jgi:hypothetical protein